MYVYVHMHDMCSAKHTNELQSVKSAHNSKPPICLRTNRHTLCADCPVVHIVPIARTRLVLLTR